MRIQQKNNFLFHIVKLVNHKLETIYYHIIITPVKQHNLMETKCSD